MSYEAWGEPEDDRFDAAIDAGWINPDDISKATRDVIDERARQWDEEGWTPEHDDTHVNGEMAKAAGCYAWAAAQSDELRGVFNQPPPTWPVEWSGEWWKLKDRRRDLVRAAALIIAEIERLDRAEASTEARPSSAVPSGAKAEGRQREDR